MGAKTDHGPLLERGAGVAQRSRLPSAGASRPRKFHRGDKSEAAGGTIAQSAVIEPAVRPRFYRYKCHSALSWAC